MPPQAIVVTPSHRAPTAWARRHGPSQGRRRRPTCGRVFVVMDGEATDARIAAFFRRHHRGLYAYARRIVGHPDKAADLVQEALRRSLPVMRSGELPEDRWPAYVYRVVHNLAINLQTRAREEAQDPATLALIGPPSPDPAEQATNGVDVRRCLARLTEDERQAYLLAVLRGFRQREIAELQDVSEDVVYRRVRSAQQKLRRCLETSHP